VVGLPVSRGIDLLLSVRWRRKAPHSFVQGRACGFWPMFLLESGTWGRRLLIPPLLLPSPSCFIVSAGTEDPVPRYHCNLRSVLPTLINQSTTGKVSRIPLRYFEMNQAPLLPPASPTFKWKNFFSVFLTRRFSVFKRSSSFFFQTVFF